MLPPRSDGRVDRHVPASKDGCTIFVRLVAVPWRGPNADRASARSGTKS